MPTLWDTVRATAEAAGAAAQLAAQKTKLRAEIALTERDIQNRKRQFGVEMYDHCSPLTDTQDFYAAEDRLTLTLRPPLISAQKEIAALEAQKVRCKQELSDKRTKRAGAFPMPATSIGEQALNAGKVAAMRGSEAKSRTDVAVKERQILHIKQEFGLELFDVLMMLEENHGWLPPDRNVRAIYDQCRRDMDDILKKKQHKIDKLRQLGADVNPGKGSGGGNGSFRGAKLPLPSYREGGGQQLQPPGVDTHDQQSQSYGSTMAQMPPAPPPPQPAAIGAVPAMPGGGLLPTAPPPPPQQPSFSTPQFRGGNDNPNLLNFEYED
eukprot:CAMPEP_0183327750 /NCGR_PEP_ID=MMETSP0160_2-20130417/83927_1 /TAXON_ID=2839 ORGANISM="Odontella Sinensis, Strain Grunow 1884" /NCGR_SAMPLE_ID=MMETSP0160_2 /ASSEMBLY_ACC=CAM_ASM_000250 /LENGTH=322 /DNA_ID=CAMNT_0025495893 /DNA_START=96 /DNA_END=1064 /DNA_ORIENTATION=-